MHDSSALIMREFKNKYIKPGERILDVGSLDICLAYRVLFSDCKYIGLDIIPGASVDIIADDPYQWEFDDKSFDHVISGQAFEHIEFPEKTMREIARVLKPGGYCCIISPSSGPQHGVNDYRRYTVNGYKRLADSVKFKIIVNEINLLNPAWQDIVLIARK